MSLSLVGERCAACQRHTVAALNQPGVAERFPLQVSGCRINRAPVINCCCVSAQRTVTTDDRSGNIAQRATLSELGRLLPAQRTLIGDLLRSEQQLLPLNRARIVYLVGRKRQRATSPVRVLTKSPLRVISV
nr:hypothetical protein [Candidatus Symbiopectobacterium sp. 'North America']